MKLSPNLARRREIAGHYTAAFRAVPGLIPPSVRPDVNPAWHLYPISVDLAKLTVDRGQIFRALRAENIGVNVHYIPIHLHPYYRNQFGHRDGECPVAEAAYERLISLPMFHGMTDADAGDVVRAVSKVISSYAK
jgi:perosamine synthetase